MIGQFFLLFVIYLIKNLLLLDYAQKLKNTGERPGTC